MRGVFLLPDDFPSGNVDHFLRPGRGHKKKSGRFRDRSQVFQIE